MDSELYKTFFKRLVRQNFDRCHDFLPTLDGKCHSLHEIFNIFPFIYFSLFALVYFHQDIRGYDDAKILFLFRFILKTWHVTSVNIAFIHENVDLQSQQYWSSKERTYRRNSVKWCVLENKTCREIVEWKESSWKYSTY